jgi:hypothetical protein
MKKIRCWTFELLEEKRLKAADGAEYAIAHGPGFAIVADDKPQCAVEEEDSQVDPTQTGSSPVDAASTSKSLPQTSSAAESDDDDDSEESETDGSDDGEADDSDENETDDSDDDETDGSDENETDDSDDDESDDSDDDETDDSDDDESDDSDDDESDDSDDTDEGDDESESDDTDDSDSDDDDSDDNETDDSDDNDADDSDDNESEESDDTDTDDSDDDDSESPSTPTITSSSILANAGDASTRLMFEAEGVSHASATADAGSAGSRSLVAGTPQPAAHSSQASNLLTTELTDAVHSTGDAPSDPSSGDSPLVADATRLELLAVETVFEQLDRI